MFSVLLNTVYRRLFAAQAVALVGTGLATVALGLLAHDIAGADAGAVLGTALAIKMIAYIGVAPVVGAFADRLPRRALLVAMDTVRAGVAMALPWVDQIWQIYALIFVLQSASAAFTPTFQAAIPDILPDEREYTRALSLSRLAYDLEALLSPLLAAALLAVISFHWLFAGTAAGFVISALLVAGTAIPRAATAARREGGLYARTTRGARIYLATPRLRGLLALTLAAAAASAMVIVNTVVIVRSELGRGTGDVAIALAAYGAGSIVAALVLPRLLERIGDRRLMTVASTVLALGLASLAALSSLSLSLDTQWRALLAGWFVLGAAYSASVTPSGRLLRRSSADADRPALFAAQFALSHACWLLTYPLVGWIGAALGMPAAFLTMAAIAATGVAATLVVWPRGATDRPDHDHPELAPDHPHVATQHSGGAHAFHIDDLHRRWPA